MFKHALSIFNRSGAHHPSPPPPPPDENNLEDPLLHAAAEENDLEEPLQQSEPNAEADDVSSPLAPDENEGSSGAGDSPAPPSPRHWDWLVIALVFLTIFGIVIYYFVKDVNHVYDDDPGFKLESVAVSSFNVSKTFPKSRWDTELALIRPDGGNFNDLDVRYEAPRLQLYSGDEGFVSSTSPFMEYSQDGEKLVLRAMFVVGKNVEDKVVNLDLLMESNALSVVKTHSTEVEIKSFLMIDCSGLKIEFDGLGKRYGTLVSGGKSCGVETCPIESHPLYDGADACTSSTKLRNRKLRV